MIANRALAASSKPLLLAALVFIAGISTACSDARVNDASAGSNASALPICVDDFNVAKNELSANIPTVGIVEWSLTGAAPSSAKIVYGLADASSSTLNRGGEAPVDLGRANYRTLLLGLKQARDYTFHFEVTRDGSACASKEYALPTTGSYPDAQTIATSVTRPDQREPGFIVTSSGSSEPSSVFIVDADGEVVWYFAGPQDPARALMDYEGDNMWSVTLNPVNSGGEMRSVSMDGEVEQQQVEGFENAHHDFTVMPGGKVAALVWSDAGIEPESDLVIRSPDGTVSSAFRIGKNLFRADMDMYHANAVHYIPADDSFTIADRNPNLFVKVSAAGALQWQLGGVCDDQPAGERCSAQDWQVNHGHHLLDDGTFLAFINGYSVKARILEFQLNSAAETFTANLREDYAGTGTSTTLGDVQRLPGGNTLVTYSTDGTIVELDASWNEVQTFSARVGYTSWRPTLYGPPPRL